MMNTIKHYDQEGLINQVKEHILSVYHFGRYKGFPIWNNFMSGYQMTDYRWSGLSDDDKKHYTLAREGWRDFPLSINKFIYDVESGGYWDE